MHKSKYKTMDRHRYPIAVAGRIGEQVETTIENLTVHHNITNAKLPSICCTHSIL